MRVTRANRSTTFIGGRNGSAWSGRWGGRTPSASGEEPASSASKAACIGRRGAGPAGPCGAIQFASRRQVERRRLAARGSRGRKWQLAAPGIDAGHASGRRRRSQPRDNDSIYLKYYLNVKLRPCAIPLRAIIFGKPSATPCGGLRFLGCSQINGLTAYLGNASAHFA
jgi:hypothetical protein